MGRRRLVGSPPRLWGILAFGLRQLVCLRFTPTPVGNTLAWWGRWRRWGVHPHACGEYAGADIIKSMGRGSPPRLWGIRTAATRSLRGRRFTPTPVGNTNCPPVAGSSPTVHPHACGEYACVVGEDLRPLGSPPRLWGIRHPDHPWPARGRFTPTPVGNTRAVDTFPQRPPVHPHACGEYNRAVDGNGPAIGSPPRLWGIR